MDSTASSRVPLEVIFENEELNSSGEEPPMDEWSSVQTLLSETNEKRILYKEGLYDPGSGQLCTKYLGLSDSSVFRHPRYPYPPISDCGILEALLEPEPPIIFTPDGQQLYLHHCEEMALFPVRIFYNGLLTESIDLRYYSVNSLNVRAMSKALSHNSNVKYLNLTESFLTLDACLHLGEMLETNTTLYELVLEGCRIGPEGLRRLLHRINSNRTLKVLNLKRNQLRDEGMQYLADAVFTGFSVVNINLASNDISGAGLASLGIALETHNNFTHIDLSWNSSQSQGIGSFLNRLSENTVLEELDMSWNALNGEVTGRGLAAILSFCSSLKTLILNNNRLCNEAIAMMCPKLRLAKNLNTLDLSFNPLTYTDVWRILNIMKRPTVQVKKVLMDNVTINDKCMNALIDVRALDYRKDTVITYGAFKGKYIPVGADPRSLTLNRIDYVLLRNPKLKKEKKKDFAHFILQLHKENYHVVSLRDLPHIMKLRHVWLENDLIDALTTSFPGPIEDNIRTIHLDKLVEYMARIWPDRKLPVEEKPPEPSPPPEPKKKSKVKGAKNKKS